MSIVTRPTPHQSSTVAVLRKKTYVLRPPLVDSFPAPQLIHVFVDEPSERQSIWMDDPGREGNDGGAMVGYTWETG